MHAVCFLINHHFKIWSAKYQTAGETKNIISNQMHKNKLKKSPNTISHLIPSDTNNRYQQKSNNFSLHAISHPSSGFIFKGPPRSTDPEVASHVEPHLHGTVNTWHRVITMWSCCCQISESFTPVHKETIFVVFVAPCDEFVHTKFGECLENTPKNKRATFAMTQLLEI